ncbi:MAG: hypothetical protein ACLUOI_18280 [Eisenbergiella sp.]
MQEFLEEKEIRVEHIDNGITFDIIVTVSAGESYAQVRIANYHTNIVHIDKDGEILLDIPVRGENEEGLTDRGALSVEDIWDFVQTVDIEDIRDILKRQIIIIPNTRKACVAIWANIGSVILESMEMMSGTGQRPWRRPDRMPV